ncbi:MAG: hypothetical protein AAFY57_13310 [Cyanobacteria bacterium J06642_2]
MRLNLARSSARVDLQVLWEFADLRRTCRVTTEMNPASISNAIPAIVSSGPPHPIAGGLMPRRYTNPSKRRRPPTRSLTSPASSSLHSVSEALSRLIRDNAPLKSNSQLLLMYGNFQSEMPADGKTGITTWLKNHIGHYGVPSLIRFGPRSRPRVLRKDEFLHWLPMPASD